MAMWSVEYLLLILIDELYKYGIIWPCLSPGLSCPTFVAVNLFYPMSNVGNINRTKDEDLIDKTKLRAVEEMNTSTNIV